MHRFALQILTWATIAAAITSALWLASANLGLADLRKGADLASGVGLQALPKEPTSAGASSAGASGELRDTAQTTPVVDGAHH